MKYITITILLIAGSVSSGEFNYNPADAYDACRDSAEELPCDSMTEIELIKYSECDL